MAPTLSPESDAKLRRITENLSRIPTTQRKSYSSTVATTRHGGVDPILRQNDDGCIAVRVPIVRTHTVDLSDAHARTRRMYERQFTAKAYRKMRFAVRSS